MNNTHDPLVSVVTPVYNGEKYLGECIRSVLAQTHQNWDYTIVNNCSTDKSLEIAQNYAREDKRIKVVNNHEFVGVIENHNIAFSHLSPQSKYCKVVSADDWITSDCLRKMVKLAESYPNVAIVGSYQLIGENVGWKGLPQEIKVISGRDVCRSSLMDKLDVFGDPTSVLYRSDVIRKSRYFFPCSEPFADTMACFNVLRDHDFGFVHEILSTQRIHDQQVTKKASKLGTWGVGWLYILVEYGHIYLSDGELEILINEFLEKYHRWLGGCVLKMEGKEFWNYQRTKFSELGYPISWKKVIKGSINEFFDELKNPRIGFEKLLFVIKKKVIPNIKLPGKG